MCSLHFLAVTSAFGRSLAVLSKRAGHQSKARPRDGFGFETKQTQPDDIKAANKRYACRHTTAGVFTLSYRLSINTASRRTSPKQLLANYF
jgi:hypothetical protein